MIEPAQKDEAFLADVHRVREEPGPYHLWWLGQSGFLLQWEGRHLLFDPYLSDWLTRKYEGTDTPHVRMTEKVVEPDRLGFIDVVTSTHNHTDHLDAYTVGPIMRSSPDVEVLVPAANRSFAADRLEVEPERLKVVDAGGTVQLDGFRIHGVPAAHEALETDEAGRYTHLGYVAQFGDLDSGDAEIGGSESRASGAGGGAGGVHTVYFSGDTVWYDGLVEEVAPFEPDVAICPINGRDPERGVPGNLTGPEAARLGREIGAETVIPCHFEMFEFNTVSPEAFVEEAESIGQGYVVMEAGARWTPEGE